jgi:hypothetical protein
MGEASTNQGGGLTNWCCPSRELGLWVVMCHKKWRSQVLKEEHNNKEGLMVKRLYKFFYKWWLLSMLPLQILYPQRREKHGKGEVKSLFTHITFE